MSGSLSMSGRDMVAGDGVRRSHSPPEIASILAQHMQNIQQHSLPHPQPVSQSQASLHSSQSSAIQSQSSLHPAQPPANQSLSNFKPTQSISQSSFTSKPQQFTAQVPSAFLNASASSFSQYLSDQLRDFTAHGQADHSTMSQFNSLPVSIATLNDSYQSFSLPANISTHLSQSHQHKLVTSMPSETPHHQQIEASHSDMDNTHLTVYSDVRNQSIASMTNQSVSEVVNQSSGSAGRGWEGVHAVQIRPPHQTDDPYTTDDNHSVISGIPS